MLHTEKHFLLNLIKSKQSEKFDYKPNLIQFKKIQNIFPLCEVDSLTLNKL